MYLNGEDWYEFFICHHNSLRCPDRLRPGLCYDRANNLAHIHNLLVMEKRLLNKLTQFFKTIKKITNDIFFSNYCVNKKSDFGPC